MSQPGKTFRMSCANFSLPAFIRSRIAHRPNLIKIINNIGWLFFDKVLRMGVGLLVGVWVARYLGPEQFGLLNFAMAFIGLFGAIATLGLQGIVVRDIVRDPENARVTLGTAAILQLIAGLLTFLLILAVIAWLRPDDPLARGIVAIMGAMMLFRASEIAVYWFESQVQSKYTVWVQNSVFLFFAVIKAVLILQQAPLIAFVWAMLAEAGFAALLLLIVMGKAGPGLRSLTGSLQRAKSLLRDSWPLLLSGIAVMLYMRIDQIMLGQMIGDEAVGIYSAAVRISEIWYFIPMAIVASVFPSIVNAKKISEVLYHERLLRLCTLMTWLSIAIALPLTFIADWLVSLLYGTAYQGAGSVLLIHIWAAVFVFQGVASGVFFTVENQARKSLYRTALGAVSNVMLNVVLITYYGINGAAVATVLSQFVANYLYDLFDNSVRGLLVIKTKAFLPIHYVWSRHGKFKS